MDDWTLVYTDFDPGIEGVREALCTLGNGFFCTRGAVQWADADDIHYPGTYVAGLYNRLTTDVAGRPVENEDLVNVPNWLPLTFRVIDDDSDDDDGWFDLADVDVHRYETRLDVHNGVLYRNVHFTDGTGRETELKTLRFVHLVRPHLGVQEMTVIPRGWSGRIEIKSALDGTVTNSGVKRYSDLANRHFEIVSAGVDDGDGDDDERILELVVRTNQSDVTVAQAARTTILPDDTVPIRTREDNTDGYVQQLLSVDVTDAEPVTAQKLVALYTSRDNAISEPRDQAVLDARRAPDLSELINEQSLAWDKNWRRCDVYIGGYPKLEDEVPAQLILRLHIFHLLQTVSRYSADLDVGVPARGWHGEAYRGHIFWDESFIYPFLDFHIPEITRGLLRYRHRRLGEARIAASAQGFEGAMFPWQSGSSGREETQVVHLNPESGQWIPDASHLQRHVNVAIAYNAWKYYRTTGDYEFFSSRGAVLMLEIAKFWASATTYNPERGRLEIHGVMGPDEYHEHYPGEELPGLNNNAYTNIMAAWIAERALQTLSELLEDRRLELVETLGITGEHTTRWTDMTTKMFIPFHAGDDGESVISQFEGYENLKEFDWDGYREKYGRINRLDRILDAEGDNTDNYKLAKQADVLMLPYLLSDVELTRIFDRLGYVHDDALVERNYRYYFERTSHGSTLSYIVHAALAARFDPSSAFEMYNVALTSDIADVQGGTTAEGVHLGVMAGTVDVMMRSFLGLEIRRETLHIDPVLAERLGDFAFRLRFHRTWVDIRGANGTITIGSRPGGDDEIRIGFRDAEYVLRSGYERQFDL